MGTIWERTSCINRDLYKSVNILYFQKTIQVLVGPLPTEKHIIFPKYYTSPIWAPVDTKTYYIYKRLIQLLFGFLTIQKHIIIYKRLIQLLVGLLTTQKHIIFPKDHTTPSWAPDDTKTYYISKRPYKS